MGSLNTNALTTLADVKETLGIASGITTSDNLIIRKINQASTEIESYCSRTFHVTTYTNEEYDGTLEDTLVLRQRPITSFTTLEARDTVLNSGGWITIPTDRYFVDLNGGILRAVLSFFGHYNRWHVTYAAGYTTIPSDLAEACATLAAYYVTHAVPGLVEQEKVEGSRRVRYQQKPTVTSLYDLIGIKDILDSYADTVVAGGR